MPEISKISSVAIASIGKIFGIAKSSVGKFMGISAPAAGWESNTKSIAFDGANDHITTPDEVQTVDNCTISIWFKSSKTSGFQNFFTKNDSLYYFATNNGKLYFKWVGTGVGVMHDEESWTSMCDGNWHHHVLVLVGGDRVASEVRWYMDGSLEETIGANEEGYIYGYDTGVLGSGEWAIGHYNGRNTFNGSIDEVAVWHGVELDADAIAAIYNSGTPIDLSVDSGNYDNSGDLSHWWRMGDGDTYPTITDNEGSNHGTMTNMSSGDIVEDVPSAD